MTRDAARFVCRICGDPHAYPLWIDPDPPEGCPHDLSWAAGGPLSIRSVAECSYQRRKAEQRAAMMRGRPDAFDENGNIKPGRLADALLALPRNTELAI